MHPQPVRTRSFTPESSEEAVASGDAQLIAIGRPFIANPDYVTRLENNQPLAEMAPMDTCEPSSYTVRMTCQLSLSRCQLTFLVVGFSPDLPDRTKYASGQGYTDFPTFEGSK
jgi:hypothetical protein